ncbi:LysR family transcriptional regulator ArgP [Cellulomonas taurus]|uniref:LysR family transcriptional regulator ArgP n=1 Tax=Cellulomonas taurus TaxID=2729175 RepID=UPI00145E9D50|nr:LysR family transcriptional regulator ArgP [Cellulomonas taurus]
MELSQLRTLLAVIDHGSFEAAADELRLTQSAVSQRIRALESSVGQVLVRRTRPAGVTDAGQVYLRLARQMTALSDQAHQEAGGAASAPLLPIAVNSDSLGSWVLPALAPLAAEIAFDLHREDEAHSISLLRDGSVMAAITTSGRPVQGCTVHRLGSLRYRPMTARPESFPDGPTREALSRNPVVVFDRKDDLQDAYLRAHRVDPAAPPRHHVPASADFAAAVRLGMGWGMLPDTEPDTGLTVLDQHSIDVTLYWQQWSLATRALDRTGEAVRAAAATHLR